MCLIITEGKHPRRIRTSYRLVLFENNVSCVCSVLSHPSHASARWAVRLGVCASSRAQLPLRITRLLSEAISGVPR